MVRLSFAPQDAYLLRARWVVMLLGGILFPEHTTKDQRWGELVHLCHQLEERESLSVYQLLTKVQSDRTSSLYERRSHYLVHPSI
jgi:hypothetical protein